MHTSPIRRFASLLVLLAMVLGMVPVVATPEAQAAAIDYASLKAEIQSLSYPIGSTTNIPKGSKDSINGIYLLASSQPRTAGGLKNYTLDPDRQENDGKDYFGYAVNPTTYVDETHLYGAKRNSYSIIKGNATSFTIQAMDNSYWIFAEIPAYPKTYVALILNDGMSSNYYIDASSGRYHIVRDVSSKYYLHSNGWTYRGSKTWAPQGTADENQFWFLKVNEQAFYLRDDLGTAAANLIDNSGGLYHPDAYSKYLQTVKAATEYYKSIKGLDYGSYNNTTTSGHRNAIKRAISMLRLSERMINAPYEQVLDYGKPVKLDLTRIKSSITNNTTANLQYMGIVTSPGEFIRDSAPGGLLCTTVGISHGGNWGSIKLLSEYELLYTPTKFLNGIETFYVVHKANTASDPNNLFYLTTEIRLIPGTSVYYEAEDFTEAVTLTKKATGQATQNQWIKDPNDAAHGTNNYREDGTPGGLYQDPDTEGISIPDYRNRTDVLFFGFDNRQEDRERYTNNSVYGKVGNYDDPTNPDTLWYVYKERPQKVVSSRIDANTGTMVINAREQCVGTGGDLYPDIYMDTIYGGKCNPSNGTYDGYFNNPLKYDTSQAEVIQYRFKMKNFRIGTNGNEANSPRVDPFVTLQYTPSGSTSLVFKSSNAVLISPELLTSNEYVVITVPTNTAFRTCGGIKRCRFYWGGLESISASALGELTIDYIYIGPADAAPVECNYGRDGSYVADSNLSDGESLFVRGNGVRNEATPDPQDLTEIKFTFTGTGFDLITRTGPDQGAYRIEVYNTADRSKAERTISSNNKGTQDLYQIPAISIKDLEYGTHEVIIMVNKAVTGSFFDFLNFGDEFYLDAIRIYNPIDVSQGPDAVGEDARLAYTAYCEDEEAYPVYKNIRKELLSADAFNALEGSGSGAVYVDMIEPPEVTVPATDGDGEPATDADGEQVTETIDPDLDFDGNNTVITIATYEKVGPKNEVYLAPGQKIAFMLRVWSNEIPKLAVGCKSIQGKTQENGDRSTVNMTLTTAKNAGDIQSGTAITVRTATPQYYSEPMWDLRFDSRTDSNGKSYYFTYVIIENSGSSGVLSITDLKLSWNGKPTLPTGTVSPAVYEVPGGKRNGSGDLPIESLVDFAVDEELPKILTTYVEEAEEGPCDHVPGYYVNQIPPTPYEEGYREAYCIRCGELCVSEAVAPLGELAFAGTSVSLHSDLAIHFKVDRSLFEALEYREPYVVLQVNGREVILQEYETDENMFTFVYRNIAPHRIGDTIRATLYAYHGDTLYSSEAKDYSVADYCYSMLKKTEGQEKYSTLRTLLVDILLYGAETQKFMSYRLDQLCTARLTEEELACRTESCRELVNHRNQKYETVENPDVLWAGAGLNLRESVAIRYLIRTEHYTALEARITLGGETYSVPMKDFECREDGIYIYATQITAAQLSEPIYITLYRDGIAVSNTVCYSVESYAYSKQNDTATPYLAELVKRMMCYGDSAKAYLG